MSRYARLPIPLPKGTELKKSGTKVIVKGPKGQLELDVGQGLQIQMQETAVLLTLEENSPLNSAMHGLYRSLINNMIIGVTEGFSKRLTLIGVGYRASVAGNKLDLKLGYSHETVLEIPSGIEVKVDKSTVITVSGINKQAVGQFAAGIRAVRPPEPYKGKGVRYENEFVRKKAGKAAKGK